jgi:hypothetical protein
VRNVPMPNVAKINSAIGNSMQDATIHTLETDLVTLLFQTEGFVKV